MKRMCANCEWCCWIGYYEHYACSKTGLTISDRSMMVCRGESFDGIRKTRVIGEDDNSNKAALK